MVKYQGLDVAFCQALGLDATALTKLTLTMEDIMIIDFLSASILDPVVSVNNVTSVKIQSSPIFSFALANCGDNPLSRSSVVFVARINEYFSGSA